MEGRSTSTTTEEGVTVNLRNERRVETDGTVNDFEMTFDGDGLGPRSFVVRLPDDAEATGFQVRYFNVQDGQRQEAPVQLATSLEDILDPSDDDTAEFWLTEDEEGRFIIVSILHWSVHTFTIATAKDVPTSSGGPTVPGPGLALVALSVLAAAGALRRRT